MSIFEKEQNWTECYTWNLHYEQDFMGTFNRFKTQNGKIHKFPDYKLNIKSTKRGLMIK